MAPARSRHLPCELARFALRELGTPHRCAEVASDRRGRGGCPGRCALGTRCGGGIVGEPDRPLRRRARRPRARRRRGGSGARSDARRRRFDSACGQRLPRGARRARRGRLRPFDPGARGGLRVARGVPRGRPGRGHRPRAAGARGRARYGSRARVAASARRWLGLAGRQLARAHHRGLDGVQERGPHACDLELADRRDRRAAG